MVDGLKEALSGLVELLSGLIIAQFAGALVELLEGDAGGEVAGGIGQRIDGNPVECYRAKRCRNLGDRHRFGRSSRTRDCREKHS